MSLQRVILLTGCWAAMALAQQLEILSAKYGAGFNTIDVTDRVRALVRGDSVSLIVDIPTLGSDPAPGVQKTLTVRYRLQGREAEAAARDAETLRIPAAASGGGFSISDLFSDRLPRQQQTPAAVPVANVSSALRIASARYGAGDKWLDVRERLQALVKDGKLSAPVNNKTMGADPAVGEDKRLEVRYEYNGQTFDATANEDRTMSIPSAAALASTPVAAAASAPMAPVTIVSARYGSADKWVDVRDRLQAQLRDNQLSVTVNNQTMGSDPAVGKNKKAEVRYQQGGQLYDISAVEGRALRIPDSSAVAAGPAQAAPVAAAAAPTAPSSPSGPLRIVSARYGAQNKFVDVRTRLEPLIKDGRLQTWISNQSMGGDPSMGRKKSLEVKYEYRGRSYDTVIEEERMLDIPNNSEAATAAALKPGASIPPIGAAGSLRIFYARYGAGVTLVDVREKLRPLLKGESLSVEVGSGAMGGDPLPNQEKTLTVIYEWKGRTHEKSAVDGQTLILP